MSLFEVELERKRARQRNIDIQNLVGDILWWEDEWYINPKRFSDHDTVVLALEKCNYDEIADFLTVIANKQISFGK